MKKIILISIFLMICLANTYAQDNAPKHLCQKWLADTTAFREILMKEFFAKMPSQKDDKTTQFILTEMIQDIGKMWFLFAENGICTMGTPREIEKGTWQYDASTQILTIQNPDKGQETQFLVKELKANRLILSEKNGDKYSQNMTFKTE